MSKKFYRILLEIKYCRSIFIPLPESTCSALERFKTAFQSHPILAFTTRERMSWWYGESKAVNLGTRTAIKVISPVLSFEYFLTKVTGKISRSSSTLDVLEALLGWYFFGNARYRKGGWHWFSQRWSFAPGLGSTEAPFYGNVKRKWKRRWKEQFLFPLDWRRRKDFRSGSSDSILKIYTKRSREKEGRKATT